MIVRYDPLSPRYKSVVGAISEKEQLQIKIQITGALECTLILFDDSNGGETCFVSEKIGELFSFKLPSLKAGLYFYRFYADGVKIGKDYFGFGTTKNDCVDFQLLVYSDEYEYPKAFQGCVMYQIFPDRFARAEGFGNADGKKLRTDWGGMPEYLPNEKGKITNDDFFGGNFEGIRLKTDYLKTLSVDCVYLNPISKAFSNHRYDTGDYMLFDPLLGNDEDFTSLVKTLKNNGISLIFDGVYNHVGDDSVYFNKYNNYGDIGAYQSKQSKYYDWFSFKNFPDEYESWWGIDVLPSIRKDSLAFEEFIAGDGGVLDRYLSLGVNGVRLDVVDELLDEFVKRITEKVKSYSKENVVIGEVWEDATNKVAYGKRREYFWGGELDSVMNYPLKDAIISYAISKDCSLLFKTVREQIDNYPFFALNSLMNILGTHDTPRILTMLGKKGNLKNNRADMAKEKLSPSELSEAVKMLKCCSLLQFLLYGAPCVYYGDEQLAEGNKDPFNRKCFEINENGELYEWYCFLSKIKHSYPNFKIGAVEDLVADKGYFSFSRNCENKKLYVAVNMGDRSVDLGLDCVVYEISRGVKVSKITLNTYDFAIFYKC